MKFEDAISSIEGAESVGGQLIVVRGGKHITVGKNVQGTLIVEDTPEAKDVVFEVDKKAFADGQEVKEYEDDHSILSTHPVEAALRSTDPMPYAKEPNVDHSLNLDDKVDVTDKTGTARDNEPREDVPVQTQHAKADDKTNDKASKK